MDSNMDKERLDKGRLVMDEVLEELRGKSPTCGDRVKIQILFLSGWMDEAIKELTGGEG